MSSEAAPRPMSELSPTSLARANLDCGECDGSGRDEGGFFCQHCGGTGTLSDLLPDHGCPWGERAERG